MNKSDIEIAKNNLLKQKYSSTITIIHKISIVLFSILLLVSIVYPIPAAAAIYIGGDTQIDGYEPSDIVSTDLNVQVDNPSEAAGFLENKMVQFIRALMPFLMLLCVGVIIYNALRNMYYLATKKREKILPWGELLKNMFIQIFMILFSFIIVEVIVFVITGGQTLLLDFITA